LAGCCKVWESLSVSKGAAQEFDLNKFILKKLSQMEVREQDYIQHSNRVAILENPNDSEDTNSDWKDIGENMKISANEGLGQYEREKV